MLSVALVTFGFLPGETVSCCNVETCFDDHLLPSVGFLLAAIGLVEIRVDKSQRGHHVEI